MQPTLGAGAEAGAEDELQTPSEAIFATVDRDGSGTISFEEFAHWWSHRAMATSSAENVGLNSNLIEDIRQLWEQYDTIYITSSSPRRRTGEECPGARRVPSLGGS